MRKSILIGMSAMALAFTAFSANATQPGDGVCARLAPQLGLKQATVKRGSDARPFWRVNMMGGLGAALFGGSFNATFSVEPLDGETPESSQRLKGMCKPTGGNVTCNLLGPLRLKIGTKAGDASTDLAPGEMAEVGIEGRHMICREG